MKREEVKTIGFVLKEMAYKENDELIEVYTYDYGRLTLHARGVKKLKSKNASAVQSLTLSEFMFVPSNGICSLIKASNINYYRYIKEDIFLQTYATYFCEVIMKITDVNVPDLEVYKLLETSFELLVQGYSYELVYLLFNSKVLDIIGIQPEVEGCVRCSKDKDIVSISIIDGGFVCRNCAKPSDMVYPKEVLKGFRQVIKHGIMYIDQIKLDPDTIDILNRIVDTFMDEYSGYIFNSKKFMKELGKLS